MWRDGLVRKIRSTWMRKMTYTSRLSTHHIIIPYKDGSFDTITVLQALHHFENLGPMMKEIQRLSAVGGTVIIREHNADNDNTKMLTDLEHMFYGILYNELSINDFVDNYYGVYRSAEEWDALFADHGFECVHKKQKKTPTKYYYAVYVNVGLGVRGDPLF
jgi:ubiquinone/menaquinone biosynthesis C-methylase UbiE